MVKQNFINLDETIVDDEAKKNNRTKYTCVLLKYTLKCSEKLMK